MTTVTDDARSCATPSACSRTANRSPSACSTPPRKHSFDPDTELDWDAPFEDGKWFWPPELVSLYDTPLWRRMSQEQQHRPRPARGRLARLARHLVRDHPDAAAGPAHLRQAGDQRARALRAHRDRRRVPALDDVRPPDQQAAAPEPYPVRRLHHNLARVLKTVSTTPGSFTCTLLGEEILDWMQRLTFPDERVQPLVRGVTRIHVVEEARHVRYAREELRRQMVDRAALGGGADPDQLRRGGPGLLRLLRQPAGLRGRRPGQARGARPGAGQRPPPRGHAAGREAADGLPGRDRRAAGRGPQAVASSGCWPDGPAVRSERATRYARHDRGSRSAPRPRVPQAQRRAAARPALAAALDLFAHRAARGRLARRRRRPRPGSPGRWSTATSPAASSSCTRPRCARPRPS